MKYVIESLWIYLFRSKNLQPLDHVISTSILFKYAKFYESQQECVWVLSTKPDPYCTKFKYTTIWYKTPTHWALTSVILSTHHQLEVKPWFNTFLTLPTDS